jgi:hypothetical protein
MQTLVKRPVNTGTIIVSTALLSSVCLPPTIGVEKVAGHKKAVVAHRQINS